MLIVKRLPRVVFAVAEGLFFYVRTLTFAAVYLHATDALDSLFLFLLYKLVVVDEVYLGGIGINKCLVYV